MRYCRGCGFPVAYGRFLEWTSDGTILGKDSSGTRLVYLDVDEIQNIFTGVSRWMGVPIDRIIYRAEKAVGRRFIETMVPGFIARAPRGKIARPEFGIKATARFVFNYMAGLGMGLGEILEYHSTESARIRITEAHSVPLVAGDGAGVFEHLERVGVDATWERVKSDEYIVTLEKLSDEPPAEDRLVLDETKTYLPGNIEYQRCKRCKVPLVVSNTVYLNLERGILRNSTTGLRVVALPAQSFDAVFRELFREFGKELPSVVESLEQQYARENTLISYYVDGVEGGIERLYSDFAWKGIGNPIQVGNTERGLEVVVENPFHNEMVAGRIVGLYEALIEDKVQATWAEQTPGRLTVTIQR